MEYGVTTRYDFRYFLVFPRSKGSDNHDQSNGWERTVEWRNGFKGLGCMRIEVKHSVI